MDTNIIALFLCMIVILLLIIKQIIFKKRRREQFTTDSLYKTEILKHLNYDISSIRNLAQLAHNAYNKDLYLKKSLNKLSLALRKSVRGHFICSSSK
jgi:predicted negative regulator of RcsB-dependent stress response